MKTLLHSGFLPVAWVSLIFTFPSHSGYMVGLQMLSFVISYQFSSLPAWLFLVTHGSATDVFMTPKRYFDKSTLALSPGPFHGPLMLSGAGFV